MCLHPFLTYQLPAKFKDGLQIYQLARCSPGAKGKGETVLKGAAAQSLPAQICLPHTEHSMKQGRKYWGKIQVNLFWQLVSFTVWSLWCTHVHIFSPPQRTLRLLNGGTGFHLAVTHYFAFLYWAQFNLCSEGRISHFLQCFQGCHSYQVSGHIRNIQMSKGKNACKLCRGSDVQLTATTPKRSTIKSWTWFVSFNTCSTREDGTFCPRLSHVPSDWGET